MLRVATFPDMWERTITIGSAGKTFSVTGWKLGWAVGPDYLLRNCQVAHQNCVYACPTPIQEAVANMQAFKAHSRQPRGTMCGQWNSVFFLMLIVETCLGSSNSLETTHTTIWITGRCL